MGRILISCILIFFVVFSFGVQAADKDSLAFQIEEYQKKLTDLRQQKSSLSSQIQYMDTQIYLTTLQTQETERKIIETEKEITLLDSRIIGLDTSLDYLSKLLLNRVVKAYKNNQISIFDLILNGNNVDDAMNKIKYFKTTELNNQKIMIQVQEAKLNFEEQKTLRENKKAELDALKITLAAQKANLIGQQQSKRRLLADTQNDEKIYQSLLAKTQAEYAAIQGIIAGAGTETKIRDVTKGETIASIIPGASCNSSAGHLHFIVEEGGSVNNPFNYLKSVEFNNCSGSSCGSGDGDSFNPSGSWDWPISPLITMYQGFGQTWAVRNSWVGQIYSSHNGLDIVGSSSNVVAVADGALYRGSYAIGCTLPYMKLIHKDSNIKTYYLHVYAQ